MIQAGNFGDTLTFLITKNGSPFDISSATDMKVYLKPPEGGTLIEKGTGDGVAFVTDGTDGQLKYVTEQGVVDRGGQWRAQAWAEKNTATTWERFSSIDTFPVGENLS